MANFDIKFEYSLKGCGWSKVAFEISGSRFEYKASGKYHILKQIFFIAVNVLDIHDREYCTSYILYIDEEWRTIYVHFSIEAGQNCIAEIEITEKIEDVDSIEKIIYKGTVDIFQFIRQAVSSATNILKKYGLTGYLIHMYDEFPLTQYLRILDYFEDYHNLDYLTMFGNESRYGYMGTNIYDEIKLLSRNLEPEYPKKDIYYYIYKGNLLELGNYLLEDKSDIDKFTDEKNDNYKETPLISAIKAGMESCALMLIRYGANVDLAIRKHTTLHHAVHAHSYSVCRKLIEMNKDLVNTPNVSWGRTPLFDIIPYLKNQPEDSNDFRIFDLLLQNNADLFHKALNKVTPMDLIETSEKHYKNNLKEYIRVNYPRIKLDSN